jgi:spermidine synthase
MLTERDEFIYHEMIAHVPLFVHPSAKSVLVIGGGDGGTVRELCKHSSLERIVMVEIDEVVVQACRRHLPTLSRSMDDPRLELIFDDGATYVAETDERFDVVIIDSTDPEGPGLGLFAAPFYENVAGVLTASGILITQAESPFYGQAIQRSMFSDQRPFFAKLHVYLYTTLTYPGGLYSFGFASTGLCPLKDFDPARVENSAIVTRYYNPGVHRAAFMLPGFIKEDLGDLLNPITWP